MHFRYFVHFVAFVSLGDHWLNTIHGVSNNCNKIYNYYVIIWWIVFKIANNSFVFSMHMQIYFIDNIIVFVFYRCTNIRILRLLCCKWNKCSSNKNCYFKTKGIRTTTDDGLTLTRKYFSRWTWKFWQLLSREKLNNK